MTEIAEKIKASADANNIGAYYGAVYEFSAVGLSAEKNLIRKQIILDLLPAVKRIHYITLLKQARSLPDNAEYFRRLTVCMNARDPDGGERVMRSYIENEKKIAFASTRDLQQL
jgi:DNA-binding FadR family transcriptional regulator